MNYQCVTSCCTSAEYSAAATAYIGPSVLVKADYAIRTLYWRQAETDGGTRESPRVPTIVRHVGRVHRAVGPLLRGEQNHGSEKEATCSSKCVWACYLQVDTELGGSEKAGRGRVRRHREARTRPLDSKTDRDRTAIQVSYSETATRRASSSICGGTQTFTEHCDFGATLDDILRDRLVCGIADFTIQRRLLAEDKLTLEKAIQLARVLEMAEKDASALQSVRAPAPAEVHSVNRQQKGPGLSPCYRCGGKHKQSDCRFKARVCHACKKRGHLARVCLRNQQGGHAGRRNRRPPNDDHQRPSTTGQTYLVDEGQTASHSGNRAATD